MFSWFSKFNVLSAALLIASLGCSASDKPELSEVTGTLTKNGQPFANALVEFYPEANAGASYGTTDEQGNFKLNYTTGDPGAAAGKHVVNVIGGHVTGGAGATANKTAASEEGEEFAVLADPEAPSKRSAGPPEPVILSAEVLADQANVITLVMP
jgi:hypothetical protein